MEITRISTLISPDSAKEILDFVESATKSQTLVTASFPPALALITMYVEREGGGSGYVRLAAGFWQFDFDCDRSLLFLAKPPPSTATNVPSIRTRAIVLTTVLERLAHDLRAQDVKEFDERIAALEAKLLSFLPAREIACRDGLVVRCTDPRCGEVEEVRGLAVGPRGEVLAAKTPGGWVSLEGEALQAPPRGAGITVVEF